LGETGVRWRKSVSRRQCRWLLTNAA